MTLPERMRGLLQPTLRRRSIAFVLLAFLAIWAVLLQYQWFKYQRLVEKEQPFQHFGAAILRAVDAYEDPKQAAAAVAATQTWQNIRRREIGLLPGNVQLELRDLQGRVVQGRIEPIPGAYQEWQGTGRHWTLRAVQPLRTSGMFYAYNFGFIGEYLLLALPFVLLPVWFSVRNGLAPLQRFAHAITQRPPEDLGPLQHRPRHAELLPLADALDDLLLRLRQRFDRERVFVQDAAHELRTPLAVVATQAHVIAHAASEQERERAYAVLTQAIDRASHVAQQLLMLASLDDAQRRVPRELDVAQAARGLLAQLAPQALARGIELSLDAPDRLLSQLDEPAFASALQNLVDNAIRYGRAGGTVAVTLRGDDERISLHVQDDGPGIPAADHGLVFERFYRGAHPDVPGSGLGLAIVKQAALRMGGHAKLTPGLAGRGVGFLMSVPVPGFVPG